VLPKHRPWDGMYLSDRSVASIEALPDYLVVDSCHLPKAIRMIRNMAFRKAYEQCDEKITRAAKQLGVNTNALYREFERYGR
jgi:transcriptional regulator of acetoin/glycerol metabolism